MISRVKISLCHHIMMHLFLDDLDKNLKQFLVIYSYYLMICLAMSLLTIQLHWIILIKIYILNDLTNEVVIPILMT